MSEKSSDEATQSPGEPGCHENKPPWWREIIQPFVDVVHAPRALWGVNLGYLIEGMVYFGILGYLAIYFSSYVFRGVEHADEWSHNMVMVLTAGITISMFFLGFVADKWGVRLALLLAFLCMLAGRILISSAPTLLGLQPAGLWSPLHLLTMAGILLVIIGYGMYQPAAYAAVRQFTTPKTAGMGFAMLYALMNLGGWLPTFAFLLRDEDYLGLGIPGTFWVYTTFTLIALLATGILLSPTVVRKAIEEAKEATKKIEEAQGQKKEDRIDTSGTPTIAPARIPLHMYLFPVAAIAIILWKMPGTTGYILAVCLALLCLVPFALPTALPGKLTRWIASHPLADGKFTFFIFAFIPVQTLFTYNWLVLPQYISRAYEGWIGEYFEVASNANPMLIFILVPIIAALTQKARVYKMMIIGTTVMALPAFLLAIGPRPWCLGGYILFMTIGEAMWQPRFLQYAAEIAPEGRTGTYMGVAQLPWFLTKVLVPLLYSGWMMERFCPPDKSAQNTEVMWLIYGAIAIVTPILLLLAKGWVGKDFKASSRG